MDRPMCRLCETKHYSYEPHKFATNSATNGDDDATNKGSGRVVKPERKTGDSISESKGSGESDTGLLQREVAKKGIKRRDRVDPRTTELLGTRIHPQVQEGGGAVSGQESAVKVPEKLTSNRRKRAEYNEYQREYMKKWRSRKSQPAQ